MAKVCKFSTEFGIYSQCKQSESSETPVNTHIHKHAKVDTIYTQTLVRKLSMLHTDSIDIPLTTFVGVSTLSQFTAGNKVSLGLIQQRKSFTGSLNMALQGCYCVMPTEFPACVCVLIIISCSSLSWLGNVKSAICGCVLFTFCAFLCTFVYVFSKVCRDQEEKENSGPLFHSQV